MIKIILSHEVKDFTTWKKGFDSGEQLRAQAGVKIVGVYTSITNPNHITVTSEFPSYESVQGFLSNPSLKTDMENSGVISEPEIKILNKVM